MAEMRYRSVDSIQAEHLGRRVTVRHRLPDGRSTDVVGVLEHADTASVTVRDRHGDRHRIGRTAIVAARVVGPVPSRRNPQNPAPG